MKALVLSGGGSHGAWQAGAIRALLETHKYDVVVGTSVGAVNAAGLATKGTEGLEALWRSINSTKDIMCFNWCWPWNFNGIYRFDPLRKFLTKQLTGEKYSVPVYVASLDLDDSTVHYDLLTGDAPKDIDFICGSTAIAGIQTPTNNRVDGGHKEQAPVRFAVETLKADEIHVILCDPIIEYKPGWIQAKFFPILSIMIRALEAMIDEIARTDISQYNSQITVFKPSQPISISSLDYTKEKLLQLIDLGYQDIKAQTDKK